MESKQSRPAAAILFVASLLLLASQYFWFNEYVLVGANGIAIAALLFEVKSS